jgi:hypothetical protein
MHTRSSEMQLRRAAIGPCSPRRRLRRLDRRTREGKFIIATEAALLDHLGGTECVSIAQRILIERTAADLLRLELLDIKATADELTDHDARIAHALRNTIRLSLRDLGFERSAPRPPTLADIVAEMEAEKAGAAQPP